MERKAELKSNKWLKDKLALDISKLNVSEPFDVNQLAKNLNINDDLAGNRFRNLIVNFTYSYD